MAKYKVSMDDFAKAVSGELALFSADASAALEKAADATSRKVMRDTKAASPTKTGGYKRGWARTVTANNTRQYTVVVHDKKKPGLTHLLEHGHGGPQPAGAHPHIVKDDETQRIFLENLRKELG